MYLDINAFTFGAISNWTPSMHEIFIRYKEKQLEPPL